MFTSLHIENFKAWRDTGNIRLAPLTILFGANSAGKSSLGQLMLALQQTVQSSDHKSPLCLGGEHALVDLGSYAECIHNHDLKKNLHFRLGWQLPAPLAVVDPLSSSRFAVDELALDVLMAADRHALPEVQHLRYEASQQGRKQLDVVWQRGKNGKPVLDSTGYVLVPGEGRAGAVHEPEKFYRFSDKSRACFRNAGFLADLALATEAVLERLYYLGPVRDLPRRNYVWAGDVPDSVGRKGEFAIAAILAAAKQDRQVSRGGRSKPCRFDAFIAQWLKDLGVIHSFAVRPVGRQDFEVLVKTHAHGHEVKMTDVGFGVSQILPALVQAFYCPPRSTVWMEQPEIHLHPQVQAELADVFIAATQARENGADRQIQLVVESHSEYLLNRLQRRIAEGVLSHEDVAIYFCQRAGRKAELVPLHLNRYGEIENWPQNFFGDEMADIAGRARAALQRKRDEIKP